MFTSEPAPPVPQVVQPTPPEEPEEPVVSERQAKLDRQNARVKRVCDWVVANGRIIDIKDEPNKD